MQYRELVKNVSSYSGFSEAEAEVALDLVTETLSSRLNEVERQDFAVQLPVELQQIALRPEGTTKLPLKAMYQALAGLQDVSVGYAKKQVRSVWRALKDTITPGGIADIRAQFSSDMVMELG